MRAARIEHFSAPSYQHWPASQFSSRTVCTVVQDQCAATSVLLTVTRYTAGANLKGIKIPRSTPAIVRFKPTSEEYDGAERDYIVAYYLPKAVEVCF